MTSQHLVTGDIEKVTGDIKMTNDSLLSIEWMSLTPCSIIPFHLFNFHESKVKSDKWHSKWWQVTIRSVTHNIFVKILCKPYQLITCQSNFSDFLWRTSFRFVAQNITSPMASDNLRNETKRGFFLNCPLPSLLHVFISTSCIYWWHLSI